MPICYPSSKRDLPSRKHLPMRTQRAYHHLPVSLPSHAIKVHLCIKHQKGSFCNFLETFGATAVFLLLQPLCSRMNVGLHAAVIHSENAFPSSIQQSSLPSRQNLPPLRRKPASMEEGGGRRWKACHHACQHLPASPSSSFHYSFLRTSSFPRRPSNAINLSSNES